MSRERPAATQIATSCIFGWVWAASEVKMSLRRLSVTIDLCLCVNVSLCVSLPADDPTTVDNVLHGGAVHDEVHQTMRLGLPSSSATPATFFLLFHGWRSRKMSWRARRRRPWKGARDPSPTPGAARLLSHRAALWESCLLGLVYCAVAENGPRWWSKTCVVSSTHVGTVYVLNHMVLRVRRRKNDTMSRDL